MITLEVVFTDIAWMSAGMDILDYLRRDMIGPEGEIFSAEDADSAETEGATRKKEGRFTYGPAKRLKTYLGKNVLIERKDPSELASENGMSVEKYHEILGECRCKLFRVRSRRPRPHLDDKVIVSWNGLAISSFVRASKILNSEAGGTKFNFPVVGTEPKEYMGIAEKTAHFIRNKLYDVETRRLQRSFRNGPSKAPGFLDDYAFLISGLLDLFEFGGGINWLVWAIELQESQDALFLDKEGRGYYNTPGEDPSVLLHLKEDHDGAEPSGNSVSAINLIRLASMVTRSKAEYYRRNAEHLLAVFETRLKEMAFNVLCCRHVIHVDPNNRQEMEFWEANNSNIALMAKNNHAVDKASGRNVRTLLGQVVGPDFPKPIAIPFKILSRNWEAWQLPSLLSTATICDESISKPQNRPLRRPITLKISAGESNFTVSYLIDTCGLAPEAAVLTSQKVQLHSPERPNSVLTLLRNHGFSKSQISKVVRKRPQLLLANPNDTLSPKLQFFRSIGVSNSDLARTVTADPTILTRSLEKQIIPSYNFLKGVLHSDEKVVAAFKRTSWIFLEDQTKNLMPNLAVLREMGVPESCIALLLTHFPEALMQKKEEFIKIVEEIKEMGFNPNKSTFVLAIHVLSGESNKSIWNRCFEVYQRWGWSDEVILSAFKKHPQCMILSENKIMKAMDFLVNKMGWPSEMIPRCPVVLFFSLEKRIKPRCSVVQVLLRKGLIKRTLSLSTVLLPDENRFLEKFVSKYDKEVPQLLSVYQKKIDFESLI
ncbi:hypothetical protein L6164_034651 [Bauhinia variegata]|uniref:Uncharacterized protein n=1 Tax=Bauhinia variegata TaxID=167791 RepID=A0ACB9KW47_BAUVA|nr:hypothetical protein L6164_034651 [Bauhinia variegata]